MTDYRAVVERHLPAYEAAVTRATADVHERRTLHKAGFLEIAYVEAAERALAEAQQHLEEARLDLAMAERMIVEAAVQEQLARLGPLGRGGFQDTATLVRFNGTAPWSLRDVPKLERLFSSAFGRSLPISAYGQTTVHDRLGLDHRGAVDIAVHPDSAEGRWLMDHLRRAGMPFIAVRAAIPGASTGAHVHIGAPSTRGRAR